MGFQLATKAFTSTLPNGVLRSRTFRFSWLAGFPKPQPTSPVLHDYVDHFDLRREITFNTRVESAERDASGLWTIKLSDGRVMTYDVLFVCNGHHWDPRTPEYPGQFNGSAFHAHSYSDPFDPVDMRGKKIVVVGMGNSAMDIASELSQRPIANTLWVAARRGVWVLPKYLDGKAADKAAMPAWMPRKLGLSLARAKIKKTIGRMEDYGLPKPDHEPLDAHPSVSGEFLTRAGCGDIKFKPNIKSLEGDQVRFDDDSVETVDVIIYATGYKISFPFFKDPALSPDAENRLPLFKRMMKPNIPNLFYMGLAQPLPTLVNFAEQQAKLAAAYVAGEYLPPSKEDMVKITAKDEAEHLGHYYASARHTIQVDFGVYVRDLQAEIKAGQKRAAKSLAASAPTEAHADAPVMAKA